MPKKKRPELTDEERTKRLKGDGARGGGGCLGRGVPTRLLDDWRKPRERLAILVEPGKTVSIALADQQPAEVMIR
jgi:hypothetical protein